MSINFIPNDPDAGSKAPKVRVIPKHGNRPASKAGFTFTNAAVEGTFKLGTPEFLFWQCREAGLTALDAWEASVGVHQRWQGSRKKLPLLQDADEDLNAFYDRDTFSFFHKQVGTKTFFSGASTDVVAHEVGHGLLDSVRSDLFEANFLEAGALHEAFADCVAMLTALDDKETRQKLLAITTSLRKRNFVETTAENLSKGIRALIPTHNAAEPRHAFNTFQFQLPQTLPPDGGPGKLIDEVHSFGMIFTGCFWDLIANLFGAMPAHTEANLLSAARRAFRIVVEGAKVAVLTPRFLQSVGRGMVLADQTLNGAANRDLIRDAFQRHNILLGTNTMVAPSMALEGTAPTKGARLVASTRRDLMQRLGAEKGAKLSVSAVDLFGTRVARAVHTREVSLGTVHNSLKGVVALAHEQVMVGASGKKAAIVGNLPNASDTEAEVRNFVRSLLEHDRIDLGKAKKAVSKRVLGTTHEIRTVGGKKVLQRVRFLCHGGSHSQPTPR